MGIAQERLIPGRRIEDRYTVIRLIGRGGMGAVYEAADDAADARVAVKVLCERFSQVPEVVRRFHREARLATAIGHANICEVIECGMLDGATPYLVMPMLEGRPLGAILKTDPSSLTEARLSRIILQTLSALGAAHAAGVIHRDLKPDNIFITTHGGQTDFVKLLDFGVAKMVTSHHGSVYTREGTVIGTPAYMAPEQAKGKKSIDHRIDIYSMGVILYEIMTGTRPYNGTTSREILFKIIAEPFLSPRRHNPKISEEMEQVIIKAMAKDPHRRFNHALEMREAFKQAAGAPSIPPSRATSAPTIATLIDESVSLAAKEPPVRRRAGSRRSRAKRGHAAGPSASKRTACRLCLGFLAIAALGAMIWMLYTAAEPAPVVVPLSKSTPAVDH